MHKQQHYIGGYLKKILFCLLLISAGCGKDSNVTSSSQSNSLGGNCSRSPVVGKWESLYRGAILQFTENCGYINHYCQSQGTYPSAEALYPQGTVRITVDYKASSAPNGCPPLGTFGCTYQIDMNRKPQLLKINCAGTYGEYERL